MTLDLSLSNSSLYHGLPIQPVAGKLTLLASPDDAIGILGANVARLEIDPEEVTLTGGMAIWAYLVVFHALHGRTKRLYYQDGRGQRVLVAAHG